MVAHQASVIVEQNLFRDTTEVPEGTLDSSEPALLPLVRESPHV